MLNMYVANGRFPRQQKIVKNDTMDKVLEVEPNGKVSFVAYIEDTWMSVRSTYSVAELFAVESGLHDFVSRKTRGQAWTREWQPPIYDVWYSFHYMNMATLTVLQRIEYFLRVVDIS